MSDRSATSPNQPDKSGSARWGLIAVVVLTVAAVILAGVLLFGGDDETADDDDTVTDTIPAETTEAPPAAGAPDAGAPAATDAAGNTSPAASELVFTIEDIEDGGVIPVEFTCDGDEQSPVITIESIPDGVLQLAFVVDDPDAATDDPFAHWLVYNIAGNTHEIVDGSGTFTYGRNDAGTSSWAGPCPPEGDDAHEYVFTLYGLNAELELDPDLDGREVADAIADSVVVESSITASYERA